MYGICADGRKPAMLLDSMVRKDWVYGRRGDGRKSAMMVRECNERKVVCLGDVVMGESWPG